MQPNHAETAAQLAALQAFPASDNLAELQRLTAGSAIAKQQSLHDFVANPALTELARMMAGERTATIQSLRDFAANPDLARLRALLDESKTRPASFDLFEVLGLYAQEAVHSNFLGWLLNPAQSHRVEDYFLKNFLLATAAPADAATSAKIAAADWAKASIHLEWHAVVNGVDGYLDILIVNPQAQILCAVENKIFSPEGFHSSDRSQLTHYREALEHAYPDFTRQYVFLSPGGMPSQLPSEQALWTPANYTTIRQLVEQTLADSANAISDEVRVFLQQYAATLRRNIVPEPTEMQQLARQIYLEHREAVELIYANKPDYTNEAKQVFKEAIVAYEGWKLDREDPYFVRFRPTQWDEFPATRTGTGLLPGSPALLLFQINFRDGRSNLPFLALALSPGRDPLIRERLFEKVRQHPQLFRPREISLQAGWMVLDAKEYILDEADFGKWDSSVPGKITQWVADFAANRFPAMNEVIINCLREYEAGQVQPPGQ